MMGACVSIAMDADTLGSRALQHRSRSGAPAHRGVAQRGCFFPLLDRIETGVCNCLFSSLLSTCKCECVCASVCKAIFFSQPVVDIFRRLCIGFFVSFLLLDTLFDEITLSLFSSCDHRYLQLTDLCVSI